jgi:DNA recombination protein Rad52
MTLTDAQLRKLKAKIKPYHIKSREADGVTLHYLEGWRVIAEANRIFGFDGWGRETVASQCVWSKQMGSRFAAAYVIRIRITVRAGAVRIQREGSGSGEATTATPGQAHELALKAAETDATKRALATFGNAFGLSLYGGVGEEPRRKNGGSNGNSQSQPNV